MKTTRPTTEWISSSIPINGKRRDTKLHPRFNLPYSFMYFFNQQIYIITPPISFIGKILTITNKALIIWEILSLNRIRIKIIIHVDSIYIITPHNITHNPTYMLATFRQRWIKKKLVTVNNKPLRMPIIDVCRCQFIIQLILYPIRINPGMKLHSPPMTFLDHKAHRIPFRFRLFPLLPSEETAPWL